MGKPPAPPWATIYEGIHEDKYVPQWTTYIKFIRRFIDDGNAIWDPPAGVSSEESNIKYNEFKAVVNNNKGLTWEFTELSNSVNFLDLTLTILPDGKIKTKLFEKPLALHLYIPPHSMHPPGVLTSHIFGGVLRMFRLNSDEADTVSDVLCLYHNFTKRGHKEESLKPLFLKAIANARKFMLKSDLQRKLDKEKKAEAATRRLYFHLEYHDQNPPLQKNQDSFSRAVLNPAGKKPFNEIVSVRGAKVPVDAMIIANHRAKNFGDLFSIRNIEKKTGPPVSSYL